MRPHRRQPIRLPCPWDSSGKNTGVGREKLEHTKTQDNLIRPTKTNWLLLLLADFKLNSHWLPYCKIWYLGHSNPCSRRDRNSRDLVEAEVIKKTWKGYTEELYKKDLNESDNHDGVVSNPEPDILDCEVKWDLGITAVNEASGCDRIPVELFKILKDDAIQVLHSICQQI